ncbi:MAG: hypothetical protein LBF93_12405, partial [Zoogloeaceae bacterium]|nr:hypothetical protein [Zoogloeaceae bacterium]
MPRSAWRFLGLVAVVVSVHAGGQEAGVEVDLPGLGEAEEIFRLPAVTVSGSREDPRDILSPGVVSVVYPDDVKGEHKALSDLLDQIPGVYVRRQSGSGHYTTASIRGSAP